MKRSTLTRTTPMARTSIQRKPAATGAGLLRATAVQRQAKKRKCAVKTCRAEFVPAQSFITWCSVDCGQTLAFTKLAKQKTAQARAAAKAARADRAATKAALAKFKKKPEWVAEVQAIFNRIVRLRDRDKPCISCGRLVVEDRPGGAWDAGHYLARGSSPHLRFDLRNVHKQCKGCNRPGGTTRAAFRAGIEARIGREQLEALEADHEPRHYTIDQLKRMKAELSAELRALKEAA